MFEKCEQRQRRKRRTMEHGSSELKTYMYFQSLDKRQGTRKPSGLAMTQNTGRDLKQEKSILIAEGGSLLHRLSGTIKPINSGATGIPL